MIMGKAEDAQVNRKLPTSWRACKQPTNTMNKRCRRLQPDPRKPVKSSNLFGWFQMEDNFKKVISCRQNEPICGPKMSGFIYKRTKRKCASNETLSIKISPIKIILCLALAELICDRTCLGSFSQSGIAPVRFATALSTPNSNNNNNSDERDTGDSSGIGSKERFVDGLPMDTVAVLGRSTDLSCLVENKRGQLAWMRKNFGLGIETILAQYADRYSLVVAGEQSNATGANSHQTRRNEPTTFPSTSQPASISNYTLHIKNVSLADDSSFSCNTNGQQSRTAKLTVLQPPSRLTVGAKVYNADQQQSEDDPNDLIGLLELNLHQQQQTQASNFGQSDGAADRSSETGIQRITVKQGSRLRLECRTDAAKPHAELVWLDGQERVVLERPDKRFNESLSVVSGSDQLEDSYILKKLVEADQEEPKLAYTTLIWSFQVNQNHANQVLTCLTNHPAFMHKQLPEFYEKQLRRRVQLDVQYPPEKIEITKEPSQAFENRPIKFQCFAQARPNQLTYRWFIDNQLVANASEPELRIERLTRQMHLRELKCEVSNSVGTESGTHRLAVLYSPAFVTHLLPASLQPPPPSSDLILSGQLRSSQQQQQQPHAKPHHSRYLGFPSSSELALGRQLAIGFERGDDIQLRCDFDSNPRLKQVLWYKMNTEYDIMTNVTPHEADDLIESGAAHAIFREQGQARLGAMLYDDELVHEGHQREHWHDKRHITTDPDSQLEPINSEHRSIPLSEFNHQPQLDYEQMSRELLDELALYDSDRHLTHGGPSSGPDRADPLLHQVVEPIPGMPLTQTSAKINEPLAWKIVRWPSSVTRQLSAISSSTNSGAASATSDNLAGETPIAPVNRKMVSLSLIQVPNATATRSAATGHQAQLYKREVSLSSSFMLIKAAREESMGKYVCKSRPADGYPPMARAVYLVQRKEPRVISHATQWAPAGARHVQVECLAEVRAVIDNMTFISWTKNGQPIYELLSNSYEQQTTSKSMGTTNISIKLERSPDFLYVRSVLHIEGDELDNYFGQYNCTITNSRGSDHLIVDLQKLKSTGVVFAAMASLAVSAVLLLVCVVGLLIVCTPRRLEAKSQAMSRSSHVGLPADNSEASKPDRPNGSVASSSLSLGRKSPRSLDSQEGMLDHARQERTISRLAEQQEFEIACANDMFVAEHQLQPIERSGSAFDAHIGVGPEQNFFAQYGHKMRSSLRHPSSVQFGPQQALRSGRFAAISETLEQKLQRGPQQVLSPRGPTHEQQQLQQNDTLKAVTPDHQVAISELERNSLINRLWARLLMKPERQPTAVLTGRRLKARPVISMPVRVSESSSGARRSSATLSLPCGGPTDKSLPASANNLKINSLNSNHISEGQFVSSKANLIQDSTTASDGTASSGRSSSSSAGGGSAVANERNQHQNELANNHKAATIMPPPLTSYPGYKQQQQQLIWVQHSHDTLQMSRSPKLIEQQQLNAVAGAGIGDSHLDSSLHVNQELSNACNQAPEQGHLYTNTYLPPANPYSNQQKPDNSPQMINGYTAQPLSWNEHNLSAAPIVFNHYQLPMLASNNSSKQQVGRSYYATINNQSKAAASQQRPNFDQTSGNYGTLPVRMQPAQMVATSDAGDAYFDANYGTLISRSSVYKTLGYAASNTSSNNQHQCNFSSSSSSPNSLTTHTNNTLNDSSQDHTQHLTTLNLSSRALSNSDIQFGDNQVAIVQSDGSTIAANVSLTSSKSNLNNKSLATNV